MWLFEGTLDTDWVIFSQSRVDLAGSIVSNVCAHRTNSSTKPKIRYPQQITKFRIPTSPLKWPCTLKSRLLSWVTGNCNLDNPYQMPKSHTKHLGILDHLRSSILAGTQEVCSSISNTFETKAERKLQLSKITSGWLALIRY